MSCRWVSCGGRDGPDGDDADGCAARRCLRSLSCLSRRCLLALPTKQIPPWLQPCGRSCHEALTNPRERRAGGLRVAAGTGGQQAIRSNLIAEGTADELKRRVPGGHIRLQFADPAGLALAARALSESSRDHDALALQVPIDGSVRSPPANALADGAARCYNGGQWQRTPCPLPSHRSARAVVVATRTRVHDSRAFSQSGHTSRRADAGRLARKT
jgi:hypothetical protein